MHVLVLANRVQQVEFVGKKRIAVLEPEAEEWKRFDGRAAANDHLRAAT